ncbi:MAG: HEPN domain-containing protein [Treponema sp.]|nr:HEPN domain-containing protein [Treponema sp.]
MHLEAIVQEWIDLANSDISTARFIMQMRPLPLEIIGFHCQQAIEKLLKAYLVFHDSEPEKTHELPALLKKCMAFDPDFTKLSDACSDLTDYAAKTRYPYRNVLDETKIARALVQAESSYAFILEKIREVKT